MFARPPSGLSELAEPVRTDQALRSTRRSDAPSPHMASAPPTHGMAAAAGRLALPPLSLYVHLPWCERKCPYCDFNSYRLSGAVPEQAYIDALLRDLEVDAGRASGRPIVSLFFGGGTPSLFSGAQIARLLAGIRTRIELAADVEITLESNPGSAEMARFAAYREAGVNRLSIGFQSLRDPLLRRLGRVHEAADALRAFEQARSAGFTNINVDLMYALPEDDGAGALRDLAGVLALNPEHVSWYQLTLEPQTAFGRRPPRLPGDDSVAAMEEQGRDLLAAHGYHRYEISAYARAGQRCRHNLNYWRFGDYLGIGAGAHDKLTLPAAGAIERRQKLRNPRSYMATDRDFVSETTRLAPGPELAVEFLMNALRLTEGVPAALLEARSGVTLNELEAPLAAARRLGWLDAGTTVLRATPSGLERLNPLLALFI